MAVIGKIKKIQLPSGNEYVIYDEATRAMLTATTYQSGVAYSKDDLFINDDTLYRANVDITAAQNTSLSAITTGDSPKAQATTIENELHIRDQRIADIKTTVTSVMRYLGVTSTTLTDGSTTSTITINNVDWTAGQSYDPDNHTFTSGAVVISGTGANQKEYAWNGTSWNEFGAGGLLKELAYKNANEVFYDKTTSISVTVPTVSATTKKISATATNGAATITSTAAAVTGYTPTKPKLVTTTVPNVTGNSAVTATNTVFGTATTASKATAGTAVSLAKAASSATNVTYVNASSLLETATVSNETLVLGSVSTTQSSITGTNGTESITPYTFSDVTVPVVSSNTEVSATNVTLGTAITVATGATDANGSGAAVVTDLGTPSTANCATAISLSTQPTITLSLDDTTGDVTVATNVSTSGTASATPSHTSTAVTIQS